MALSTEDAWTKFFKTADLEDAQAAKYSKIMVTNRVTRTEYLDNKEILKELGITSIGDILNIIRNAKKDAKKEEPQATSRQFKPKIEPPTIKTEMTKAEFRKFRHDWGIFRTMTDMSHDQIAPQMYTICEQTVQSSIIASYPNFFESDEDTNLNDIEAIVTKSSNPAVHRLTFSNLTQSEGESIQSFIVRLKSSALDCSYSCPTCKADLAPGHIKDQLIRGLNNSQLQADILAKSSALKTLEDIVKHAQAYEAAIRDQSSLNNAAEAMRISEYRRQKSLPPRHPTGAPPTKPVTSAGAARSAHMRHFPRWSHQGSHQTAARRPCKGCGSTDHSDYERETKCPAWGKTCNFCHRPNHIERACFRKQTNRIQEIADEEENPFGHLELIGANFTSVSAIESDEIKAKITTTVNNKKSNPVYMHVFPDSGASICLAGTQHLQNLNRTENDLTPSQKRVRAVGGTILTCKGYLDTQFEIDGKETKQNLYICDNVDRVYFSKDACKDVDILSKSFPRPMTAQAQAVKEPESEKIPYPATTANVPKLKDHLIRSFPKVFEKSNPFPEMKCKPVHIHLKDGAKPHAIHTPIPVPINWGEEIKASLDKDVENGVLEEVPIGEPVEWCSLMVVVAKKDGRPRRTVDLQELNAQCSRETHHCMSPFKLACQIPKAKIKTVVDATDGYHSIPLDEESRPLTTFITQWGRYRYKRLPQGFIAAGDAYTRRYDEIIKDIKKKIKCVDDTLLWADNIAQAYRDTWRYLQICQDNGITLNKEKFQFAEEEVTFAGLTITMDGICPTKSTLKAIDNFPKPKDITDARSWFGLVNTVAWTYSMTQEMLPFRNLVKPNAKFYWDQQMDLIFDKSKQIIREKAIQGIRTFDVKKKTCLQTDWSRNGIGYLLLQQHCSCNSNQPTCCKEGWQLVFAGSRFTKGAEERYSPTEGEALAVAWSLEHARFFVLGCSNLIVSTDHKPLEGILKDRTLASINNPRILSLKERTLPYQFKVCYNPGKWHRGPDAMSRNPSQSVSAIFHVTDEEEQEETILSIGEKVNPILTTVAELTDAAKEDKEYQSLLNLVKKGFPRTKEEIPSALKHFWGVKDRLGIEGNLVTLETRIVIPKSLRSKVLTSLHSAHQGVDSMTRRAEKNIYWPGMTADIRNKRYSCLTCNESAPSLPKEPYCPSPPPDYPFQHLVMDFFQKGHHHYLTIADCFTSWFTVYHMNPQPTSSKLIEALRNIGLSYGLPEIVCSDGGPQFTSAEFQDFLKICDIRHRRSSAYYPQSNGRAELAVKTAKRLLENNTAPNGSLNTTQFLRAMMQYRNTPIKELGLSPAQLLFHRQLRDAIPTHPKLLRPHKQWVISAKEREQALAEKNQQLAASYNQHAKTLPYIAPGSKVLIQEKGKWYKSGTVIKSLPFRQYEIKKDGSGFITVRNRRFLKKIETLPSRSGFPMPSASTSTAGPPTSPSTPPQSPQKTSTPPSPTPLSNSPPPIQTQTSANESVQTPCQAGEPPTQESSHPTLQKQIADFNKRGREETEGTRPTSRLRGGKDY